MLKQKENVKYQWKLIVNKDITEESLSVIMKNLNNGFSSYSCNTSKYCWEILVLNGKSVCSNKILIPTVECRRIAKCLEKGQRSGVLKLYEVKKSKRIAA